MSRRLVFLTVAVAAVATWLFLFDLPGEERALEQEQESRRLLPFDPARAETLRVERPVAPWTLVRRSAADGNKDGEAGWWLVEPIVEKADDRVVESVLRRLSAVESERRVAEDVDPGAWERYGLSEGHPARADFVVSLEGGERVELRVGAVDATEEFVYLRAAGSDALDLALSDVAELAMASHHGFRRMRVFEVEPGEIVRIEVDGPAGRWVARRDPDSGLWTAELDGRPVRLRRWEVDDFVHAVAELVVVSYQRDGLQGVQWSGYGLDDPWASVGWVADDGRRGRLDLGNQTTERRYFARRSGLDTVFEVTPGFEETLERDPRRWIDDNPLGRNLQHVASIRLEDGGGPWVEQVLDGMDWKVRTADGPVEVDEYLFVSARNVLLGLEEMQATQTLILPEGGTAMLERAGPAATLDFEDGSTVRLDLWWREDDVAPWVRIDDERTLHRVDRGVFMRLRAMLDAARAAAPLDETD